MRKGILLSLVIGMFAAGSALSAFAAGHGLSAKDKRFFRNAASGGMMEVKLGQIAQEKAQSQDVKDFGNRMVTDHGKANEELKGIAEAKKLSWPDKLEHKDRMTVERLSKLSGAEFDKGYMKTMVRDHTKDVADFKKAVKHVKDTELNQWAGKTLPVLESHLKEAKDIEKKLGK